LLCMRTNIDIDDELIAEAARLTGIKTKKDLVHQALRVLIESKKRKSIFELEGKIELDPDYDYKAARGK
jgi:Arc/MetJ family transcription regulator